MGIDDAFFNDYTKIFGKLYEKIPKQLIHGNPTGDAIAYENGEVVGIKGYEIYNVSHTRLFDIVWCAGPADHAESFEACIAMFKEILKGYDSLNLLTAEEKQSIYYVWCAANLNTTTYGVDTSDLSNRGLKAIDFLTEKKEMFLNLL